MFPEGSHQYEKIIFPFLSSKEFLPKKITLECSLKAFSSENIKVFQLNIFETYQFEKYQLLPMLHKSTVNWRNIWDFWSSLKTKMFNITLCWCQLKGSSIFPNTSYILGIPTTHFMNIMFRLSSFMEFWKGKGNICKIPAKKKFGKYNLDMSP